MNSAPFNLEAAGIFRKCAEMLRQQAANPFRVNAYNRAAQTLESLPEDARDILRDGGVAGLIALPAIGQGLAALLGRGRSRRQAPQASPPVEMLLDVDREYRQGSAAGKLPKITPKRFNPEGLAWLPILHTARGKWHFTALFSNTARAHELGRTDDWVIVYFYDDDHQEGQNTIVTETKGPMTGERVIRGREAECRALTN